MSFEVHNFLRNAVSEALKAETPAPAHEALGKLSPEEVRILQSAQTMLAGGPIKNLHTHTDDGQQVIQDYSLPSAPSLKI